MWPLFHSVWIASLLGSVHCVGMCGPLLVLATHSPNGADAVGTQAPHSPSHAWAYHTGRGIAYALLGLAAGGLGGMLNLGGAWLGVQRVALVASAVLLIGLGLRQIAKAQGWWPAPKRAPKGP